MKLKIVTVWLLLISGFGIVTEVVLRLMGYQPGDLRPNWLYFQPVDSLYVIPQFRSSKDGVLIADSAYWAMQGVYVNNEGFRTINFSALDRTKRSVMVIGDSFTWGLSASPIQDSSFCDLLTRYSDLEIINFGIPAADPVQYSLIADKYINGIHPDYVFVMFFTGNDIMRQDRKVVKGQEAYFWTNAGGIYADIDGYHFDSAQSAYQYLATKKYYLSNPSVWYEKIIASSSLLSRFYAGRFRIKEKVEAESARKDPYYTLQYLYRIKKAAKDNNVPLKFILIPEKKDLDKNLSEYYKALLKDAYLQENWLVPSYKESFYTEYPDGHWNNQGHVNMALYLTDILNSNRQ